MKKTWYEKNFEIFKENFYLLDKELPNNYSYEEYLKTDFINSKQIEEITRKTFYHLYCYYRTIGRIYEVRETLTSFFLYTPINISTSLFKSPFEEIIISLPDNFYVLDNVNTSMKMPLKECYVNFIEKSSYDKKLSILFYGAFNEEKEGLMCFDVVLQKKTIDESLEDTFKKWENGEINTKNEFPKDSKESWLNYFKFVCNTIIYITSPEADIRKSNNLEDFQQKLVAVKSPKKRKKLERKLESLTTLSTYIVGSSIDFSKEEIELYDKLKEFSMQGYKLNCRFPVGGHWRSQWYGTENNKYQRPKWIKPFLKGPEMAEIIKSIGIIK